MEVFRGITDPRLGIKKIDSIKIQSEKQKILSLVNILLVQCHVIRR